MVASAFTMVVAVNDVLYHWFSIPMPFADTFPWPYWVFAVIAACIAVPSLYLML